jgi:phospholipid/cholesterol/gamma-HCH transport system ATP-binding protein
MPENPMAESELMSRRASRPVSDRSRESGQAPVAIRLRGIRKAFDDKVVLDGLDFDVREGDSVVILGGSGSGKSVLLKHMIGLLRPDEGTVEVDGTDLATLHGAELTSFRRRFGMAFQEGALFDSMSVADNIAFPLKRAKWDRGRIRRRVDECIEMVHLEGAEGKMPAELSGGMRRRVGFARAIALEPRILLFDEPTTGLDPVIKAVIDVLILELQEKLSSTAVTITHDLASAFRIADRVALLFRGRIVADAPPEEFRELADPRVRQFVRGLPAGPLTEET